MSDLWGDGGSYCLWEGGWDGVLWALSRIGEGGGLRACSRSATQWIQGLLRELADVFKAEKCFCVSVAVIQLLSSSDAGQSRPDYTIFALQL